MGCSSSKQEEKRKWRSTRDEKLRRVFTDTAISGWWVRWIDARGYCVGYLYDQWMVVKRELHGCEKFKRKQTPGAKNACSINEENSWLYKQKKIRR